MSELTQTHSSIHEGLSEKEPDLAEVLGVIDGDFDVHRTDGTVERGWLLSDLRDHDVGDGVLVSCVTVRKYDSASEKFLFKTVPVSTIEQWNRELHPLGEIHGSEELHNNVTDIGNVALKAGGVELEPEDNPYDHLFRIDEEQGPDSDTEFTIDIANKDPRLEAIFAPKIIEDTQQDMNFDHLFVDASVEIVNRDNNHRLSDYERLEKEARKQTPEGVEIAKRALFDATGRLAPLKAIIARYRGIDWAKDYKGTIDEIYSNLDLRYEIGTYLLHKVDELAYKMPDRIARNTQKSGSVGHERNMTSRQYVAVLALDILAGAYNPAKGDKIEYEHPHDGVGQHRRAVETLLDTRALYEYQMKNAPK